MRLRTAAFIFVSMIVVFSCLYIRLLFRVEKLTSETSAKKEFDNGVPSTDLSNIHSAFQATVTSKNEVSRGETWQQSEKAATEKRGESSRDVIVYLAQFGHHSTYGNQTDGKRPITGSTKLNRSLETLYTNYANRFPCDVIVFYGEDDVPGPSNNLLVEIRRNRPGLQIIQLNGSWWSLPHGLRAADKNSWRQSGYSIGYRHMMEWYAVRIWPFLTRLGYTHVMRMDDDSYLHSKIGYNMFDYMRSTGKRYAFRQPVIEGNVGIGFFPLVDNWLKTTSIVENRALENYKKNKGLGFYNNFFIADISFFMSPPASELLDIIDRSKLVYEQRCNDLIIQSVLVRLLMPPEQVVWLRDFTYEHTTLGSNGWPHSGCVQNGGISRGIGAHSNNEWKRIQSDFKNRFSDNPNCVGRKLSAPGYFIGAEDVAMCEDPKGICAPGLKDFVSKPENASELALQHQESQSWHDSVAGVYNGSSFRASSICGLDSGIVRKVAEWNICWDPIQKDLEKNECIVYSFGIAADDPFTNFMDQAGCQVFAFDPAQQHPEDYKPNTKFYPYGLVSGIGDEGGYSHIHWGNTTVGEYKTLAAIKKQLGHEGRKISALKIDCEGCEWNLFASMEVDIISSIGQVSTHSVKNKPKGPQHDCVTNYLFRF